MIRHLFIISFLLIGCAAKPRVLLVGDSILAGGMSSDGKGVQTYLEKDFDVKNLAVGGSKPQDVIKVLSDSQIEPFDYVFVYTGTNDMGNPRKAQGMLSLLWLNDWFKVYMPGSKVFTMHLLKLGGELELNALDYNDKITRISENVFQTREYFQRFGCDSTCMWDAVHPNDKGYEVISKGMREVLT